MKNLFCKIKDEKGIALLFTLGILALILVLALGFATTAVVQRKNAGNNVEGTVARILADSTLDRVVGSLQKFDESSLSCSHCDSITHPTSLSKNRGTTDWLYRLGTLDAGSTNSGAFIWDTSYASADGINWEYVMADDAGTQKIIGRVAYVIIPGGGIDPGDLVKSGANEALNTEPRIGVEVNEINLQSIGSEITGGANGIADKMNYNILATPNGLYTGTWLSFARMFKDLALTSATTKDHFRKWFVIDAQQEAEAYWIDDNNDNIINIDTANDATNELYNRFNLTQSQVDWDAKTNVLTTVLAPAVPAADEYNSADGTYQGGVNGVSGGIPWLRNWQSAETFPDPDGAGSLTGANSRGRQIAANIIDYCDSNRTATTDSTTAPTYTGNDQSPYINEIRLEIEGNVSVAGVFPSIYTCTINIKAVDLELVNIYDTSFPSDLNAEVTVSGEYNWSPKGGAAITFTDKVINVPITGASLARAYKYGTSLAVVDISPTIAPTTFTHAWNFMLARSITNFKFTKIRVKLTDTPSPTYGGFYDYSYVESDSGTHIITANGTTASLFFDYAINDPRQNLNDDDWGAPTTLASINGTIGTKNTNCIPNPGGNKDLETGAVEPWDVSTAYIRNAPMLSPWELGCIHRGAAWETINLKEYNRDAGVKPNRGGSNYSDSSATHNGGDANILDQIKMTSNVLSDKKVSLKLQTDTSDGIGVLNALFKKIRIGNTYADPGNTGVGTELTLTNGIVNYVKVKSLFFTTRSMVAVDSASKLIDGSGGVVQDTDAKQEEIIGKIINLCNVKKSEYFTVIVLAQSIKDLGTPTTAPAGITISRDLNHDGIIDDDTTTKKGNSNAEITVGFRDDSGVRTVVAASIPDFYETMKNCRLGQYDLGADEILSEQKIKAEVHRDPVTKKCKILKVEYLEE